MLVFETNSIFNKFPPKISKNFSGNPRGSFWCFSKKFDSWCEKRDFGISINKQKKKPPRGRLFLLVR